MYSLLTISCYFGKLPEHFPEFLRSVAMNPTVDFLLITDCSVGKCPPNLRIHNCTFEQLRQRIQSLVDFPIVLDRPYKLCDYKPVWGLAFPEYIQGYDFWGYCDLDMILGDIRSYLPDDTLSKYDKIYKLGHLTYYRNTSENNARYMLGGGVSYKTAFSTEEIVAFDEIAGMQNIFDKHGFSTYFSRDYADITYGKVRFTLSYFQIPEELRERNNYEKQLFYWEDGHVYRAYMKDGQICREEFNYIHFSRRKMTRNGLPENCQAFFITNRGLFEKTEGISKRDFDRYNPHEPIPELCRAAECWRNKKREQAKYYWGILKSKLTRKKGI